MKILGALFALLPIPILADASQSSWTDSLVLYGFAAPFIFYLIYRDRQNVEDKKALELRSAERDKANQIRYDTLGDKVMNDILPLTSKVAESANNAAQAVERVAQLVEQNKLDPVMIGRIAILMDDVRRHLERGQS